MVADYEASDNPSYMNKVNVDINGKSAEAMPYMDPTSTIVKSHPTAFVNRSYSTVDEMINDDKKSNEVLPYMNPTNTAAKDYPTISGFDYEALPELTSMYEKPAYGMPDGPSQYEEATVSIFRDSMVGEELPDDEQIYEDPGHNKEEIYLWLEEKKFRKLNRSNIKYVAKFV